MVLLDKIGNTMDHAAANHNFVNGDIVISATGAAGNLQIIFHKNPSKTWLYFVDYYDTIIVI